MLVLKQYIVYGHGYFILVLYLFQKPLFTPLYLQALRCSPVGHPPGSQRSSGQPQPPLRHCMSGQSPCVKTHCAVAASQQHMLPSERTRRGAEDGLASKEDPQCYCHLVLVTFCLMGPKQDGQLERWHWRPSKPGLQRQRPDSSHWEDSAPARSQLQAASRDIRPLSTKHGNTKVFRLFGLSLTCTCVSHTAVVESWQANLTVLSPGIVQAP